MTETKGSIPGPKEFQAARAVSQQQADDRSKRLADCLSVSVATGEPLPAQELALDSRGQYIFSKGLPHDEKGVPDEKTLQTLLAVLGQDPSQYPLIKLAGPVRPVDFSCVLALSPDPKADPPVSLPPIRAPPRLSSPEQAAEMVELYWMALLRDVPFKEYHSSALAQGAAKALTNLLGYQGPRNSEGRVTTDLLFRARAFAGPYVSAFYILPFAVGIQNVEQHYLFYAPGTDYLIKTADLMAAQDGKRGPTPVPRIKAPRLMSTLRDGISYVHLDEPDQSFANALRILLGLKVPRNKASQFAQGVQEAWFIDGGAPELFELMASGARQALAACWQVKWSSLRMRPEMVALLIEQKSNQVDPTALEAPVLDLVRAKWGSALLPQAYPEGCPAHPSYPCGHCVIATTLATILKAYFDGDAQLGSTGLLVGEELDKLASNIANFRDAAGVHFRSDEVAARQLGEQVALGILQKRLLCYPYATGFRFRLFDGTVVTLTNKG